MNGRFNRLVCALGIMFCGLYSVPLIAASDGVYRPVDVRTVSRDLARFKMENRYHLEKMATQATNPFGTMPKNKALTVTTGKSTLGNIARGAKKGSALNLAVMAAVAGAGWAIDELTNQVTVPVQVPADGSHFAPTGYEVYHDTFSSSNAMDVLEYYLSSRGFTHLGAHSCSIPTPIDVNGFGAKCVVCELPNMTSCYNINQKVRVNSAATPPMVTEYQPVLDADFNDEILPKLANVPSHHWDPEFKDSAGRPKMTPELQDALHDWFEDLADRDPNLTYNRATGKFTYNPPSDDPENPSDPVEFDPNPQPPAHPDEWEETRPENEWPGFCDWATVVCDWLEWTKEEPEEYTPDELPVDELSVADIQKEYNSGLGGGSCPAPVTTSYMGQNIVFEYDNACWAASNLFKPVLLTIAGIMSAFIIIGASRRAV